MLFFQGARDAWHYKYSRLSSILSYRSEMTTSIQPFVRNHLTWMGYVMLGYIIFIQSMLGPLMPFLRDELHLSYTQGGLLPSLLAIGLILAGFSGDLLAGHFSRKVIFWGGSILLTIGGVLLGLSRSYELVFIAVLGMGLGSSLTQIMIQAFLADQHGVRRSIAISEANVAASLSTTLAPLVIGSLSRTDLGWQSVSLIAILLLALLGLIFHREAVPDPQQRFSTGISRARLPISFWLYWIVIFLVVAVEMSLAIWSTDFLVSVGGLSDANAALVFGAFPAAMFIGRLVGSRLTRHYSSYVLVLIALGVTLSGFLIFWLNHLLVVIIIGLFVTGLGVANLYPLIVSIAVGLAPEMSNQASARASLGVGMALLSAPFLLGWLADSLGFQQAFGIVTVFILAAAGFVIFNHLVYERRESPSGLGYS